MKLLKLSVVAMAIGLMSFNPSSALRNAKAAVVTSVGASIKWASEELDLGEIPQGKPASIDFEFKNTGNTPVIIESVQAGCGCTTTNYAKTPILPGETTKISATYNAAAKGSFRKTVTVKTNAEELPKVLTIKGVVI